MDFEFLQKRYQAELERRRDLAAAVNMPVGVLTALGGLLGFLVRDFSYEFRYLTGFFLLSLTFAAIFFVAALVYLVRSYWNHAYHYVPVPGELHGYLQELQDYYASAGQPASAAEADFADFLQRRFREATDANTLENDSKSGFLHKGNTMVIGVLVMTLLAGICYMPDTVFRTERVPRVEVTNFR